MKMPALVAACLTCLTCFACQSPDEAALGAATPRLRLEADPGPPPNEQPPRFTVWREGADGWSPAGRVVSMSASGRVQVDLDGQLVVDGTVVADRVQPAPSEDAAGRVAYARGVPPEADVWLYRDGTTRAITHDGESDRPFLLPDGTLLWIGNVDGRARWMRDGVPLGGSAAEAPPPARPQHTRWDTTLGAVVYDAGEREWALWPHDARAVPR